MSTATNSPKRNFSTERESTSHMSRIWHDISPARRWSLVWPREHGAWGILLVALITGAAVGLASASNLVPLLWLTLATLSAFCLRTPLENSMPKSSFRPRTRAEWRWVSTAAAIYVLIGGFTCFMLLLDGAVRLIWMPAVAAAGLFALQAALKRLGRAFRLLAEILAAFGLTLAAAAGCIVAAGKIDDLAIGVWLVNGLFAANQILYVQFRIREAHSGQNSSSFKLKRIFLLSEAVLTAAIIAGAMEGLLPGLTLIAFLPLLVRGGIWSLRGRQMPLRIHRLGKTELAHAIAFGLLFIVVARIR